MSVKPVVVGVDKSQGAVQAAAWAADEARSRGVGLRLICAYGAVFTYGGLTLFGDFPILDEPRVNETTARSCSPRPPLASPSSRRRSKSPRRRSTAVRPTPSSRSLSTRR